MKPYLGVIAAVIALIVGASMLTSRINETQRQAQKQEDFDRIAREYLERVPHIRTIADEKSYKDEVPSFFRWYFKEVNEHLNRFGGEKNFDGYLTELKERSSKGKEPQLEDKKAYYEYARAMFDGLRSSTYSPVFSATSKSVRLDVVSTGKVGSGDEAKIRMPIIFWGAQRYMTDDGKVKKMITSAAFRQTWKIYDAKGKLHGEMNIDGDPAMRIDWPERFIKEFPPQLLLGYYEIGLLPPEAAKLEIQFFVSSRAPSGGDAGGSFTWRMDVPEDWKLPAGSTWKGAEEDVRAPEQFGQPTEG